MHAVGGFGFCRGNTLLREPSSCQAARRWRKRHLGRQQIKQPYGRPFTPRREASFGCSRTANKCWRRRYPHKHGYCQNPWNPPRWMEIYFRPPSAAGSRPTYSSAASFGHFCLRGDVRSFSNKTPAAGSAKRVIHTSQIPVRVSSGLKSLFSGVTWQLTRNF